MEVTPEVEMAEEASLEDADMETKEARSYRRKGNRGIAHPTIQKLKPVSLELLPQVRINVQPETPISTLKCMVMSSTSQLSYNKTELKKAEELMTRALIEFYQKLQLLKGYR